jgi:signal transduction histidine kinase
MTNEIQLCIDNIRSAARSMKSLVDDLLSLEKIDSERQSAWVRFDLASLVQEVYEAQKASAGLKNQDLQLERPPEPVMVLGSTTQMRQAIANLINNASKYTPNDGKIMVRMRHESGRLAFEVEDNGLGIPADRQARLFQRFYRAKQPGTDNIPGTGLGLSLVKTVINRHGGDVWVRSVDGTGSTFGFWLPEPPPEMLPLLITDANPSAPAES